MIIDEDAYLAHHGVKGMKWGVRNEPKTIPRSLSKKKDQKSGSKSQLQKDLDAHPQKPLTPEQKANVDKASAKFEAQLAPSNATQTKGWRPTKKQVATVAIGAAAAGAIIGGIVIAKKAGVQKSAPFSLEEYKKVVGKLDPPPDWMAQYAGKPLSKAEYQGLIAQSRGRIWGNSHLGYITPKSFDQKETVFNAGHEFFRVSHGVEKSFAPTTYMTPSRECLARYHLGWKDATTNIINFKAKEQIRVPDLHTRLEVVREVMAEEGGWGNISPRAVIQRYGNSSGGSWDGPFEKKVIRKLIDKGFDALVDDMDAGIYGEMPLVLFSPQKMTEKITTLHKNVNIGALESILTEIPNRR